jgi:peptidoglycan/LPS O-acetylase OafA/YrhL
MKTENKFLGLDHLRALAITLVFFYHYRFFQHPAWMEGFSHFGWCGVDLFFVLSGFLISNQLFAEWQKTNHISLRIFYLKRFFRILPPYLFVLCIYIFVPAFHEREALAPLWKMLTFTQNFGQNIRVYGTFSHVWSLCVEEQFYLLLPLLLLWTCSTRLKQKSAWLIPAIFVLTLVLRWIVWWFRLEPLKDSDNFTMYWYQWIYYPTYTRLDGLVMGVGIAAVYRFRRNWLESLKPYANWMSLAGCLFFALSFYICSDQFSAVASVPGFSIIAVSFGLFVLSAILPGSFLFKTKSFITKNLAMLSYSLYLSHKGLIHITQNILKGSRIEGNGGLMFLICILVCIGGALLMRVLIEKPALIWRNKILRNGRIPGGKTIGGLQ